MKFTKLSKKTDRALEKLSDAFQAFEVSLQKDSNALKAALENSNLDEYEYQEYADWDESIDEFLETIYDMQDRLRTEYPQNPL